MDAVALAELDRRLGIPGVAKVGYGNGGLPRIQISTPLAKGEMYLHGAHVTSWIPTGHDEVLFLSSSSQWQEGQAIRGGIPICFPWFRAKADEPQAPAHGFVRTKMWRLESISENERGVTVTLSTETDEQTRHWWPGEFHLLHRVTFGTQLKLEVVCNNIGTTLLRFEEALHTYNRVGEISRARLQGLDGARFLDNMDSNKDKMQLGDVAITSPTDSAYIHTQNAVDLMDPKIQRRIRLQKANSLTTVVWNPWREGASKLRDLGDGQWQQFLCVEASNILGAAINLAPGEEHILTATLSVEKL